MPQESLRKRPARYAVAAIAAAGALALAGCTAAPADPGSEEPVSLRIAVLGGPVESAYSLMAREYAKINPNVTFEVEEIPNEQYGDVLRTQLQGGNAADLFWATGGSGNSQAILSIADAGYVLALTDTVANELVEGEARALIESDGVVWGQALDFVPISNNYNVTVADELGLSLPFETVADVLDACDVAADAGKSLLMIAGAAAPNAGLTTLQMAASRVYSEQPDWNELRAEGKTTFADTPGWRESLEQVMELSDSGCFQVGAEAGQIADNIPAVATGAAVGSFAPAGLTNDMKRLNPENDFVATAFPGEKASETRIFASPTNLLAVNAASSEAKQAAALKFLAWLAEPEQADATAAISGNLSIRAGAGGSLPEPYAPLEPYFTDGNYQALANLFWPNPEVYTALGTGVQGLLTQQTTIDDVLAAMDTAWDSAS